MAFIKKIKVGGESYDVSLNLDVLTGILSGYGVNVFSGPGNVVISGLINTEKNSFFTISGEKFQLGFDEKGFYISSGEE